MKSNYSIKETADLLNVTVATVYSYERNGILKREEDPHHLKSTMTFSREHVEALIKEKEEIDKAGPSISEFAKKNGVYTAKVKEAIKELGMEVEMVRSSIKSDNKRYSLSHEQELQLTEYLSRQRTTRAKRNHLYYPGIDLALYQPFLIAGERQVRLTLNEKKEMGFQLDSESFVPYMNAIQNFDLEPVYGIHKEKQLRHQGFSDITVPTGRKALYIIIDAIYNVCGIENFNADIHQGSLVISVRNGTYASNYPTDSLEVIKEYLENGDIEVSEGAWHFKLTKKTIQIQVDSDDMPVFVAEAERQQTSVKDILENFVKEKAKELDSRN